MKKVWKHGVFSGVLRLKFPRFAYACATKVRNVPVVAPVISAMCQCCLNLVPREVLASFLNLEAYEAFNKFLKSKLLQHALFCHVGDRSLFCILTQTEMSEEYEFLRLRYPCPGKRRPWERDWCRPELTPRSNVWACARNCRNIEQRLSSASIKFLWLIQIRDPSGISPALDNALSTLLSCCSQHFFPVRVLASFIHFLPVVTLSDNDSKQIAAATSFRMSTLLTLRTFLVKVKKI